MSLFVSLLEREMGDSRDPPLANQKPKSFLLRVAFSRFLKTPQIAMYQSTFQNKIIFAKSFDQSEARISIADFILTVCRRQLMPEP